MTFNYYEGVVGLVLSAIMIYYTARIIRNFQSAGEVSVALFFPHRKAEVALRVLNAGLLVFAASMAAGSLENLLDMPILETVSKLGVGATLLSLIFFLYTIEEITGEA